MERLQKIIAESGYASRRKAEVLITEGKVKVNGKIVNTLGSKASLNDVIEVEGNPLEKESLVTYVFYKPEGCVSTVKDEHNRRTVVDYINDSRRIYPVGRLDYDTSGLLLLTNDGTFANEMTQPKSHLPKVYDVTFTGILRRETSHIFEKGMILEGKRLKPVKVTNVKGSKTKEKTSCTLTLYEGKNHQIKKMLEAFGHQVTRLKRVAYGPLTLEGINKGQYRLLSPHEKKQLHILTKKPNA
jgi:23S rRNA pseudouridine2605 synthase